MTIYFAYSDESGSYHHLSLVTRYRTMGPVRLVNQFFIRSVILIDAQEWSELRDKIAARKDALGVGAIPEIKWNHCLSAVSAKRKKVQIGKGREHAYFEPYAEQQILEFVDDILKIISDLKSIKIFFTASRCERTAHKIEHIEKWHLQNVMQRIQMQMEEESGEQQALCVLFFDNRNEGGVDGIRRLRNTYNEIFKIGDFLKYKNIVDCLNFHDSAHSIGIQCADFVAGCFIGALTGQAESRGWWEKYLLQKLRRRASNGQWQGYGIIGIPKQSYIEPNATQLMSPVP